MVYNALAIFAKNFVFSLRLDLFYRRERQEKCAKNPKKIRKENKDLSISKYESAIYNAYSLPGISHSCGT
jgi:hypothetical protein